MRGILTTKRIIGLAMIKNEADVIESFARHNLEYVDELHIILQQSVDGTREIIEEMICEGLDIKLHDDNSPHFNQGEKFSEYGKALLSNPGCQTVVLLDADEFIKAPTPEQFTASLLSIPSDTLGYLLWESYVPTSQLTDSTLPVTKIITSRLVSEHSPVCKVLLTKRFLDANLLVPMGSHIVYTQDNSRLAVKAAHIKSAALAHFPVRSEKQIVAKIKNGVAALDSKYPGNNRVGHHWRKINSIIKDDHIDFHVLQLIAADYQFKTDIIDSGVLPELIFDPLPCAFQLKYFSHQNPHQEV
ncbi:MAG: glycosyltransferase family 2 protein [Gallionellaceae bacterium]